MMCHKKMFGIAAILFGVGFVFQSILPANAIPTGPNVSLGSNPVFAVQASGASGTLFTNTTSSPVVVTDLAITESTNATVTCQVVFSVSNGGNEYRLFSNPAGVPGVASLNSGLLVPAGESLTYAGNGYCSGAAVSGYHAH